MLRIKLVTAKLLSLLANDEGQDLVEYALLVALMALGATAGLNSLASGINAGFSTFGAVLSSSIT